MGISSHLVLGLVLKWQTLAHYPVVQETMFVYQQQEMKL
jgi:hypothetical protein